MKVLQLSEQQLANLKRFLSRAQLTGNEAPAFVDLARAIDAAQPLPKAPAKKAA